LVRGAIALSGKVPEPRTPHNWGKPSLSVRTVANCERAKQEETMEKDRGKGGKTGTRRNVNRGGDIPLGEWEGGAERENLSTGLSRCGKKCE